MIANWSEEGISPPSNNLILILMTPWQKKKNLLEGYKLRKNHFKVAKRAKGDAQALMTLHLLSFVLGTHTCTVEELTKCCRQSECDTHGLVCYSLGVSWFFQEVTCPKTACVCFHLSLTKWCSFFVSSHVSHPLWPLVEASYISFSDISPYAIWNSLQILTSRESEKQTPFTDWPSPGWIVLSQILFRRL